MGGRKSKRFCHGDQVDMVGRQAVAEDAEGVLAALAVEGLEVEEAVGVGAEDGLAVVAALGDVVRGAGQDAAFFAGHPRSLWPHEDRCK